MEFNNPNHRFSNVIIGRVTGYTTTDVDKA